MILDYASPSALTSDRTRATLGLAADRRRPLRFDARVTSDPFLFRVILQSLGKLIWSHHEWVAEADYAPFVLDPIITVHDDRVFFEAFSSDNAVYGAAIFDRAIFETRGDVINGTTNVDFTGWLFDALGEMRSSRETWLSILPEGFSVQTADGGGRFEKKVDVPDPWVRGFLQLMSAMAMPGTRFSIRPVEMLAALRFLKANKAKVSPRALRYELAPGDSKMVLEPWEHEIALVRTEHNYDEKRVIRTWGRRKLQLLDPLLPYAEGVDVYLKGRAMPSFYVVRFEQMRFVLGLTGGAFDVEGDVDPREAGRLLSQRTTLSVKALAEAAQVSVGDANVALTKLCRQGLATYDVETREFRHRELFDEPIDEARLFPPDPQRVGAQSVSVEIERVDRTRRESEIVGRAIDGDRRFDVRIVLKETHQIIFGTCGCEFFREHLLREGPCMHMFALKQGAESDGSED